MAVVKTNYIKQDGREKAQAKATIRYIQHRPGKSEPAKTEGNHMIHSSHSYCCELAEMSNPEQLWYEKTYHSLDCNVYSPDYWLKYYTGGGWSSPDKTKNNAPKIDTVVNNPTIPGDSTVGTTPGQEKERLTRTLFGRDGAMGRQEAYRMIDSAEKGSVFWRFIMSPDPQTEDTKRDLHLRDVTEQTMLSFEERMNRQVQWVAAVHDDHAPHRHVHIVAVVPGRLRRQDFQALPQVVRHAATQVCLEQRQELDRALTQQVQEREEAVWELSH